MQTIRKVLRLPRKGALDDDPSYPLVFRGLDGDEYETFIHQIRRHALAAGKQRDEQWLIDFATSCFVGDALRWQLSLPKNTWQNWELLQRAMLDHYVSNGVRVTPSRSASGLSRGATSATMVSSPTSASLSPPLPNKGAFLVTIKLFDGTSFPLLVSPLDTPSAVKKRIAVRLLGSSEDVSHIHPATAGSGHQLKTESGLELTDG